MRRSNFWYYLVSSGCVVSVRFSIGGSIAVDRLGYDQPSKAVDWLINKAKNAIAKLDELPE
ncbi:hypothetical protein RJ639_013991 [Escallonia herrerae]|uniref:TCP domain-containing protein n=1 Tax=Escallonia herrerae TaxID=1293975 RepID=A0AA88VI93_9ASTE|nr:hypothetical protein RJ639_013991 [Escallonia herrerae]